MDVQYNIIWQPQTGPQEWLISCPIYEVFFGGARGGGKTDGMLGEWIQHAQEYGASAKGVFFRRELVQLDDVISRAMELFIPLGAEWKEQKKTFVFPNGATLKMRPLERDSDAEKYQGHSYTRIYIEEITNFPDKKPILKLHATLRSKKGIPCLFRATGNPGGPGHMWVKERYINPAPGGLTVIKGEEEDLDRIYIPSRVGDNNKIDQAKYIKQLKMTGNAELVRAWLEGDWDIVAGAAFETLKRDIHMVRPFTVPYWWTKFTALDWGSAKPYAIGWFTVADEDLILKATDRYPEKLIGKGSVIMYRELYGWNGKADEGCRKESWEVANEIADLEELNEEISYRIADSAMWAEHDGPSIAENMERQLGKVAQERNSKDFLFKAAMEKSRKDRRANYQEIRNRLSLSDGEQTGFYIFDNCTHFWRTIPDLQLDTRDPEKGWDSTQEDHMADCVAYALASRPVIMDRKTYINQKYDEAQDKAWAAERGSSNTSRY